jgi:hypothetical protein
VSSRGGEPRRRTFIYHSSLATAKIIHHSSFMLPCLAGNKSIALAQMKNDE